LTYDYPVLIVTVPSVKTKLFYFSPFYLVGNTIDIHVDTENYYWSPWSLHFSIYHIYIFIYSWTTGNINLYCWIVYHIWKTLVHNLHFLPKSEQGRHILDMWLCVDRYLSLTDTFFLLFSAWFIVQWFIIYSFSRLYSPSSHEIALYHEER